MFTMHLSCRIYSIDLYVFVLGHREISQGARRIGSGRIIARDVSWDYRPDKGDLDGPEYGFGRSGPGSGPGRERKDTERDREDR